MKWIKNLFVSKELKAANKRILELETEVATLKGKIHYLETTFIPKEAYADSVTF